VGDQHLEAARLDDRGGDALDDGLEKRLEVTGLEEVAIGDTLTDPESPDPLPRIEIDEPTVRMTFGVNTSPFTGREGKFSTTRQLRARLYKELDINLGLHVEDTSQAERSPVSG